MIEKIVFKSRLNELKDAVQEITDENEPIILASSREVKETKRGSKYRGVSKNGKKWQVSCFKDILLYTGDGDG